MGTSGKIGSTPKRGARRPETGRLWLFIVLLLYIDMAFLHAVWVPTAATGYQNAPDEAAHVSYVMTLRSGRLPDRHLASQDTTGRSYEWHQPPLYYAFELPFSFFGTVGMRVGSILIGVLCILMIYRGVVVLIPYYSDAVMVATGFAALLPTHIAITSTVNNDVLLELLFTTTLALLAACMMKGLTYFHSVLIGIVLGLALLTKMTGLLLVGVIVVGLVLMLKGGEPLKKVVGSLLIILGIAVLISGWWFVRNKGLYGEYVPIRTFNEAFRGTAQAAPRIERVGVPTYALSVSIDSFKSFWAVLGNSNSSRVGIPIYLPDQVYLLPAILVCIAGWGMTVLHIRRNTLLNPRQILGIQLMLASILLVAGSFAMFLTHYYQTQGRYLYPAMLPISIVFAAGIRTLVPVKYRSSVAQGVLFFLTLLCVLWLASVQAASTS